MPPWAFAGVWVGARPLEVADEVVVVAVVEALVAGGLALAPAGAWPAL